MSDLVDRGRRVGRYQVAARLGGGGVTDVFLARVVADGPARFVVLKQLRAELRGEAEVAKAWLEDLRVTAGLVHAYVGRVLEVGVDRSRGDPFVAMEHLAGQDLASLAEAIAQKGFQLPFPIACRIVHDLCLGLHAGHVLADASGRRTGVVHGSLTPRNVLVTYAGHVRVLDFGVARARAMLRQAHPGQVYGTMQYLSPEQVLDHPVDARADVFAAGTMLYELLTGRRMHASEAAAPRAVVIEHPPALSTLAEDITPQLDAVVLAALEKNADDRPASAQAFARALAGAVALASEKDVAEIMLALFDDRRRETEALLARLARGEAGEDEDEEKTASMAIPGGVNLGDDEPWNTTQEMTAIEAPPDFPPAPPRRAPLPPPVAEAPPPPAVGRAAPRASPQAPARTSAPRPQPPSSGPRSPPPPADLFAPPPPAPADLFAPPPPAGGARRAPSPSGPRGAPPPAELFAPPPPPGGPRGAPAELFAPPPPAPDERFAPPPPPGAARGAPSPSRPRAAPPTAELFAPPPPAPDELFAPPPAPGAVRGAPSPSGPRGALPEELFAAPPPPGGAWAAPPTAELFAPPPPAASDLFAPPPPAGAPPAPSGPRAASPPSEGLWAPPPPPGGRPSSPPPPAAAALPDEWAAEPTARAPAAAPPRAAPAPQPAPAAPARSEPPAPPRAADEDAEQLGHRRAASERRRWVAAVLLLVLAALAIAWFIETKWLAPLPELPQEIGSRAETLLPRV